MKVAVITLAFDNLERVDRALGRFKQETDLTGLDVEHFVLSISYPLPSHKTHEDGLIKLCDKHQCFFIKTPNLGQDGNIRNIENLITINRFDVICFYDPDTRPRKPSWLKDAGAILIATKECDFVTINCRITDNALCQQTERLEIEGIPVARLSWPGGWPMFIMSPRFWTTKFHKTFSFYGGSEANILNALKDAGKYGVMMTEHDDARDTEGIDLDYLSWKYYAIHRKDALSFDEWLREINNFKSN